jgi:hypothetical protein
MQLVQRLHNWVVWSDGRVAYGVLVLLALLPFAIAPLIGTWQSTGPLVADGIPGCEGSWKGLDHAWNWWIWPVVLPASLWVLRRTGRDMFGSEAAIVKVVTVADRPLAKRRLNEAGHDARLTAGALLTMAVIIPAEFWGVGSAYLAGRCPAEKDWTVFFLAESSTGVSRAENLLHVLPAYAAQYLAGFFGILIFALFFRHNWLYLRWIYQRHRRHRSTPRIELDFDDELDCCFGQQKMRRAFNPQMWVLFATGGAIVVSRAINIARFPLNPIYPGTVGDAKKSIGPGFVISVLERVTDVNWHHVYNDAGQVVLVVMFMLVFLFVSMPSLVKFLPFRAGKLREEGAKKYLAEFIPPGDANDPDRLEDDEISQLAAKFRNNSFWPAGDNVAQRLFAIVFAVLLFVLLPVPVAAIKGGLVYAFILAVVALALTAAMFVAYRYILGYVATVLVKDPKK